MKAFLVTFVTALLFINGSLAGTGSDQRCSAAVIETSNLSSWILNEMNAKLESLKGVPMEVIAEEMDKFVEEMMTRDNLTLQDVDILHELMADTVGPRGEITIRIYVWGCYIKIHVKW